MLNERARIGSAIASARGADEIVVVDGGSTDDSPEVAARLGAQVVHCEPGRGRQLSAGVLHVTSDVLLFLHADTVLPAGYRLAIERALASGRAVWGWFDVRFDHGGPLLRLIAHLICLRSRITRIATGDQAMFVLRTAFDSVGGIHEPELFEDIDLSRRLKRNGPAVVLRDRVTTASRRWSIDGVWWTTLTMWSLRLLYACGVSAARLKRFYRDTR